jgi:hypothetical protein
VDAVEPTHRLNISRYRRGRIYLPGTPVKLLRVYPAPVPNTYSDPPEADALALDGTELIHLKLTDLDTLIGGP